MRSKARTAAAVIIGNEILSGKVRDENTPYLVDKLRELGVALRRIVVIPDVVAEIAATVRACSEGFDHVFTSGGVGPTHDDVTFEGVACGFGVPLQEHPELAAALAAFHPRGLTPATLRMARVPAGSELVHGGGIRWPAVAFRNVFILAGVPFIFRAKLDSLEDRLRGAPFHCDSVYVTLDESVLAPLLEEVLVRNPGLEIGSYPRFDNPSWRVRLTLEHPERMSLDAATRDLLSVLPESAVQRVERSDP